MKGMIARGITTTDLFIETIKNIRAASVRSLILVLMSSAVGFLTAFLSATDLAEIDNKWTSQLHQGANAWVVTSLEARGLDTVRCDQLNEVDGVLAAGGILGVEKVSSSTAPVRQFDLLDVTPGMIDFLWTSEEFVYQGTPLLGHGISSDLGVVDEGHILLNTTQQMIPVESVQHASRIPSVDDGLVVPSVPDGEVNECYVEAAAGAGSAVERLLISWFPEQPDMSIRAFVDSATLGTLADVDLRSRVSQYVPFIGGALVSGLSLMFTWTRRSDYAIYRMMGLRRTQTYFMTTIETVLLCWFPMAAALVAALSLTSSKLQQSVLVASLVGGDILVLTAICIPLPAIAGLLILRHDPSKVFKGE